MMDQKLSHSLLHGMLRIRLVEEKIAELYPQQEMRCPVHLCIGQEAIPVGVCSNLQNSDTIMGNHRSHGHYLAKGGDLKAMMAEIYGKATGCSGGKGGSMHLTDLSVNILGTTPIVGSIIPIAVGAAFASSLKNETNVTLVFLGRAATEEGVFFESLNFAALKNLPIVFVSEDNFFSVYSPLSDRQPDARDNASIAQTLGISNAKGDGNNINVVNQLAGNAIEHVRAGRGPYFLEFETYRWREHCGPHYDNDIGYRSEEEFLEWKKKCPIENFKNYMVDNDMISQNEIDSMCKSISNEMDDAVAFAKSSPFPNADQVHTHIYADEQAKPDLSRNES